MKKANVLSLLLAAVLLLSTLTACGAPAAPATTAAPTQTPESVPETTKAPADSHYPVTITNYNYAGEPVQYTYEKAPEKVIAVYQGCIETMIALGLEDHVLASYGLDNEVKEEWKAGFEKMNYDASVFSPDKETVTMLAPDMIFSWGSYFSEKKLGDVDAWNAKNVGTYMNSNTAPGGQRTLENEYTDILNIGKIFDVEDKAQAIVDEMKAAVAETTAAVQGQEPVRVAILEPYGDGKITNYGANSLGGDMVVQLGGELVAPDVKEMSKEALIAADPDVIFVVYMPYDRDIPQEVMAEKLALIQDDSALASLSAIRNGRVVPIMLGDMYASGPRTADGIATFAQGMYPELSK